MGRNGQKQTVKDKKQTETDRNKQKRINTEEKNYRNTHIFGDRGRSRQKQKETERNRQKEKETETGRYGQQNTETDRNGHLI